MPRKNTQISKPIVIAVEGRDYLYFLLSQINRLNIDDVHLWDFKEGLEQGNTEIGNLKLLAQERAFKQGIVQALGIIKDAEDNRDAEEDRVQGWLASMGLKSPDQPMTVQKDSAPATAYLIVPHGHGSGCLEHACLQASNLPAAQVACADAYLNCISSHYARATNDNHRAKVQVHALIAGHQQKPAMTLGESADANMWNFEHPSLKVMLDFIQMMRAT